ncbi:hypothetical protein FQR65_LT20775 [Abscondita terminalis]|nr:hypothetical protein FQR65_LT20775 [Abscondita terminalis]
MAEGSLKAATGNVSVRPKARASSATRCGNQERQLVPFYRESHPIGNSADRSTWIEDGGSGDPANSPVRPEQGPNSANAQQRRKPTELPLLPRSRLLPCWNRRSIHRHRARRSPELPTQKPRAASKKQFVSRPTDASVLASSREQADYFEQVLEHRRRRQLAGAKAGHGSGIGRTTRRHAAADQGPNHSPAKSPRSVFEAMANGEGSAGPIIDQRGLKQVTDSGAISAVLDAMLAANAEQVPTDRAADEAKPARCLLLRWPSD